MENKRRLAVALLFVAIACVIRGFQFHEQVLMDDEWHAVHHVMSSDVMTIMMSFGLADYSIPLTLYYKALAWVKPLTEADLRAPMFLSSLLMVFLCVRFVWARFNSPTAIIFGALLVCSPLLFYYSRIARPYGISLLVAPVCLWWFCQWWEASNKRAGVYYALSAVMLTWLHLLNAPFVFAPLALVFLSGGWAQRRFWQMSMACSVGLALTLGPPLVTAFAALTEKSGTDLPTMSSYVGALHQWIGTPSRFLVLAVSLLACVGFTTVLRRLGLYARAYCMGIVLTLLAIYVLQPAWVFHPLTFARYLVLLVPALLLCVAAGLWRIAAFEPRVGAAQTLAIVTGIVISLAVAVTSPLADFARSRTSYVNHSYYHFDVRASENIARRYVSAFPQSTLWGRFTQDKIGEKTIAYFPASLYSYFADAPVVQALIGQQIIPASAEGLCQPWQPGHPKRNAVMALRNFAVLADVAVSGDKRVDFIAMRKSFVYDAESECRWAYFEEEALCQAALTVRFGTPVAEDDLLVVFNATVKP